MYHRFRSLHRVVGVIAALFLLTLATTGFLLALKSQIGWMRPPAQKGAEVSEYGQVVSVQRAAEAAFALGIAELQTFDDIDRIDYRPGKNIYKVLSKEAYHEVQIDGSTGKVLSVSFRGDQLAEDIHDLSFFKEQFRILVLPVVGVCLFTLASTGIVIFFVPVVRRRRFRRQNPK